MKTPYYTDLWLNVKSRPVDRGRMERLTRQLAHAFMDAYLKDGQYREDYVELLCDMATYWKDPQLSEIAARELFTVIIESLCDEFEELQTATYNRVMSQVISFCRRLPTGDRLDHCLEDFGLHSDGDLLKRIQKVRSTNVRPVAGLSVKSILLLSRVTIGADVAITSVIIQRLTRLFPDAGVVLIGGDKLKSIFGANSRLKIKTVNYKRHGGLLERLASWQQVLKIVQDELSSACGGETILVDPDSRLSQLGVLPLISMDRYYFFDSRSETALNHHMSMAQLTNSWLDQVTATKDFCSPTIWLQPETLQKATRWCATLKRRGASRIVAVNFGVGGNPRKTLGGEFEFRLLKELLRKPGTLILLDQGFGEDEQRRTTFLINAIKKTVGPVFLTTFEKCQDIEIEGGLIGLKTQIGEIAAIISQCDEYIGYDSAGQHIAAAVGTPCLTIFAGSNNLRFIRRWSAFGPERCRVVPVDNLSDPGTIEIDDIITRTMKERNDHLK